MNINNIPINIELKFNLSMPLQTISIWNSFAIFKESLIYLNIIIFELFNAINKISYNFLRDKSVVSRCN